ncbi:MAG TPA: hypothetical protein VF682_16655 [Pseudomonas sp.]|jgi:hypothetical protein
MSCFELHRKYPAACPHAVGLNAPSIGTRLLSLSTIADAKISNPPWVNFQSAGWVSFQSAPTTRALSEGESWRGFVQWRVAGFKTCTLGNLPELTKKENAGSDHAAFWVDLDI